MNILDGVKSAESKVSKEAIELSKSVKDENLSLIDRIESFEDIMDIEVGDTALKRAKNVERDLGLRQLYIKYEGDNAPTLSYAAQMINRDSSICVC